ncbi:MAG TPA: DNA polymerase III subunit beta [Candidatus Saccharimonadales bacterium]|nr:DNA polymerase III subunit beta [Candidatus Saccharimonadales bacterium]
MKLKVTQENLSAALNTVAKVANTHNTLPILSNVLIKTSGNRLSVAATNLDVAITQMVGSKISEEGSLTIPARLTQDFVASLPNGVIDLTQDENKLNLSTDKYESTINGMPAEDFPVMPAIAKGQKWNLPAKTLKHALQQIVFAASTDEARPVLTGLYFHSSGDQLYVAATDSYRLAEKALMKSKDQIKLLIPVSAMQELLRILTDSDEDVTITSDDQQVLFKVGGVELVARLIEGQYPDYQKLIPQNFTNIATLKRADFVNITKVSSLFARESGGSVTIELDSKTKQVSIRSIASQLGENTAAADAKINGSGQITLNSRFLMDGLNALNSDEVSFSFNGKLEPSVLKDPENSDYLHVIMPLKS